MANLAFAEKMVTKYETLLLRHAGTRQLQNDGSMITLTNLEKGLEFWEGKRDAALRTETSGISERPLVAEIDLR